MNVAEHSDKMVQVNSRAVDVTGRSPQIRLVAVEAPGLRQVVFAKYWL